MNHILIIIAFNLIIYFKTLRFTIICDDIRWYKLHENGWCKITFKNFFQEIPSRLYGGATFGNNPEVDHAFTLSLHILACCLLYCVCGHSDISFWASILYSCNPINNQTSIWLNGRRYLLNIILVLLSLLAWQHHMWYLSIPLWASTAMFQVTAVFAPILWGQAWLMVLPAVFLFLNRHTIMRKVLERHRTIYSKELLIIFPRRIIVVIKSYGFYFFKMIFPHGTAMHYDELYFWGLTKGGNEDAYEINIKFYKGLLAVVASIIGISVCRGSERFMVVFAIISLLQWCNIIYAVSTLADRYCNMSNVFMMYFMAKFMPQPFIYAFIGYYLMSLSITMRMYPDIFEYFKYHVRQHPNFLAVRVHYINYLLNCKSYVHAFPLVDEGLKFHPNNFRLLYQAAQCWNGMGNKKEAMSYLMRCKENYYEGQEKLQEKFIQDFVF